MDDSSEAAYQCKICQLKFKTTSEFQKHKRLSHRNETSKSQQQPIPPSTAPVTAPINTPTPTRAATRSTSTENSQLQSENKIGITFEAAAGGKLSCSICHYIFDTRDPVVSHLLRQRRGVNGSLKCPFCVKSRIRCADGNVECLLEEVKTNDRNSNRKIKKVSNSTGGGGPVNQNHQKLSFTNERVETPKVPSTAAVNHEHRYELTYKKTNEDENREPPVKVAVLVNSTPVTSDKRLAVPKSKEYAKGNITCQYCGFVADSFQEVKFHINTHLAKSYPCDFCSNIYRSKQGVMKHTISQHSEQMKAVENGESSTPAAVAPRMKRKRTQSSDGGSDYHSATASNCSSSDLLENGRQFSILEVEDSNSSSFLDSSVDAGGMANGNFDATGSEVFGGHSSYFAFNSPATTLLQQHGTFMFGGGGGVRTVEKVLELANF